MGHEVPCQFSESWCSQGLNDDFRADGSPQYLGIYLFWSLRLCNVLLKPTNFATCVEDGGGAIPNPF